MSFGQNPKYPAAKLNDNGCLCSDILDKYNAYNNDIVAWLYLPGTNLNFPVAQREDTDYLALDSYYLTRGHWVREFDPWDEGYAERHGYDLKKHGYEHPEVHAEEGEKLYVMAGVFEEAPVNPADADHHAMADGWITVSIHNVDSTDRAQLARSQALNRTF